ncbi:MAG TPA: hypothetical protein VGA78_03320 [Gemmatimonadales bacterium]|jgi:hypothetical protein
MPFISQWLIVALAAACSACLGSTPSGPRPDPDAQVRILFVGNSLTYFNDLPGMVKALSDSLDVPTTQAAAVAFPDYALEDHWNQGEARSAIQQGSWTHVVMQQGPSALESSRQNLLQWIVPFDQAIREQGGLPGMYMVWPSSERSADFDRVSETYRLAAQAINGLLFPAGDAWRAAWRRDAALELYGGDGFHPTAMGTYLAAITIAAVIHQRSPVGMPRGLTVASGSLTLPAATATLLQEAATEAIAAAPVGVPAQVIRR